MMLSAPFTGGVSMFAFYAMQPYLLQLYGNSRAYAIAGLAAAVVAGAQIAGGLVVPHLRRLFRRRTSVLLSEHGDWRGMLAVIGILPQFWPVVALISLWGLMYAASTPVRQAYLNNLIPSNARATVLSFDSMLGSSGRGGDPAGARQDGRRVGVPGRLRVQRRRPGTGDSVALARAPRAREAAGSDRARLQALEWPPLDVAARHACRTLRGARPPRAGRHGPGIPGARYPPQARRRAQGAGRVDRQRSRSARALPARSAGARFPQPHQHRPDLRDRRRRRRARDCHGARTGADALRTSAWDERCLSKRR